MLLVPALLLAHGDEGDGTLAKIGPAPEFSLTTQTGARLSLIDLRGKVVAVTFIYASCTDRQAGRSSPPSWPGSNGGSARTSAPECSSPP